MLLLQPALLFKVSIKFHYEPCLQWFYIILWSTVMIPSHKSWDNLNPVWIDFNFFCSRFCATKEVVTVRRKKHFKAGFVKRFFSLFWCPVNGIICHPFRVSDLLDMWETLHLQFLLDRRPTTSPLPTYTTLRMMLVALLFPSQSFTSMSHRRRNHVIAFTINCCCNA